MVPGEAFGTPGYLRLSYALGDDDLVEGVTRLQKLAAESPLGQGAGRRGQDGDGLRAGRPARRRGRPGGRSATRSR